MVLKTSESKFDAEVIIDNQEKLFSYSESCITNDNFTNNFRFDKATSKMNIFDMIM